METFNKKLFILLSVMMGLVVISSNFLVQFPVKIFGLEKLLTYGAFSYPVTFLITDLANRAYGKGEARKIVYIGFVIGVLLSFLISTNFKDIISIRIAIGSGVAFFVAQNLDINIFDKLRQHRFWFTAPLASSIIGSTVDTFLFFGIAFYGTGISWLTLSLGDLTVKLIIAMLMLVPFKLLLGIVKDFSSVKKVETI